jgi:hypothetical protein
MDAGHKRHLEKRHNASEWHGRGGRGRRLLKGFSFDGSEIRGWTLHRVRRDEAAKPPTIRTLWRRGEEANELLAVDLFECASVRAAHDQLIEALGNIESDAVERQTEKDAVGDVAFALDDTMALFARANAVVLIRNAGPMVVKVGAVAHELDALLARRLEAERPR